MLLLKNKIKMLILAVGNQKTITLKIGESFAKQNTSSKRCCEVKCVDFSEEGREHQETAAHTRSLISSTTVNNNPMGWTFTMPRTSFCFSTRSGSSSIRLNLQCPFIWVQNIQLINHYMHQGAVYLYMWKVWNKYSLVLDYSKGHFPMRPGNISFCSKIILICPQRQVGIWNTRTNNKQNSLKTPHMPSYKIHGRVEGPEPMAVPVSLAKPGKVQLRPLLCSYLATFSVLGFGQWQTYHCSQPASDLCWV